MTPPEPAAPPPAPRSIVGTIALGLALIVVLTPLTQFLTLMTINADIETASPVGWAVGLVLTLVVTNAVFFALVRRRLIARERLVLLYAMLTIAVPVMNLGLLRPFYLASVSVLREYLLEGTSTYRIAYNALNPDWTPVVPSPDALAWHRADRLLRLLANPAQQRDRASAFRELLDQLEEGRVPDTGSMSHAIARLGPDEAARLSQRLDALEPASRPDWASAVATRTAELQAASAAAAAGLSAELATTDEQAVSLLPETVALLDSSALQRLEQERLRLTPAARQTWDAAVADAAARAPAWRAAVGALGAADQARVRAALTDAYVAQQDQLSPEALEALRHSFVFRLNREERLQLIRPLAGSDAPAEDLYSLNPGLLTRLDTLPGGTVHWWQHVGVVLDDIPWHVWTGPLLRWGGLFLTLFLLIMCVAEWLRRKWVERENLAFPLVEMIDSAIRHDARLEVAEDPRDPPARVRLFYPPWVWGALVGLGLLTLEALGHYGFVDRTLTLQLDLSKEVFANGPLREMSRVTLAVSPIVVGLLFLVSLEMSFSIWVSFMLYTVIVWLFQVSLSQIPRDELYTGWGGGRFFPFPMEQLLGAALAFAAVILWRTWRGGRTTPGAKAPASPPADPYVPPRLLRLGLIVLPLVVWALLWDYGLTHLPLLGLSALVVSGLTLTAARVRAETGLPTQHVTYEFAKLPLVFGLTGSTGAAVYTRFIGLAFLPLTLLWRTLPQQLENLELARRHRIPCRAVAVATLLAFVAALTTGLFTYLLFNYALGDRFTGGQVYAGQGNITAQQLAHYPLWVSHFLGEHGLNRFTQVHGIRLWFMAIGAGVVLTLVALRHRFLRFPIHPIGYLVVLLSLYFYYVTNYPKGLPPGGSAEGLTDRTLVWGSALVAWGVKRLLVNYGGMTLYKRTKPFFTGLILGSVAAIFLWNVLHLGITLVYEPVPGATGWFLKHFVDAAPYSPRFY